MSEMSRNDTLLPKQKNGVQVQQFDKEVVLYDESTKRVHVLNTTAQFIWEHCNGVTSLDGLVEEMGRRFSGVSEDILRRDVEATLKRFRDEHLFAEP